MLQFLSSFFLDSGLTNSIEFNILSLGGSNTIVQNICCILDTITHLNLDWNFMWILTDITDYLTLEDGTGPEVVKAIVCSFCVLLLVTLIK